MSELVEKEQLTPIASLKIVEEPGEGDARANPELAGETIVPLYEGMTFRIGRAKANDFTVENRNVSRFHAVFSVSASGVVLSDLSSLNGTEVNGARITTPVAMNSGDRIVIGDTTISIAMVHETGDMDSAQARTQTAQLAAVVVTVLVVDVAGYTKKSEALPPKDVTAMLNLWFQNTASIVEACDGVVDKYIGDCVMALWTGKGSNVSEHVCSAVEAAQKMIAMTKKLSLSGVWSHHEQFPWECRVALNTGEALMGIVGGGGRRDFTVLGDTVNVAFRLEGVAKEIGREFIVGQATADLIKDKVSLISLGGVTVSGRRGEISIFAIEANDEPNADTTLETSRDLLVELEKNISIFQETPIVSDIFAKLSDGLDPKFSYHSLEHTKDVLKEAIHFALYDGRSGRDLELLAIAAAYHDAGFLIGVDGHEVLGAKMVGEAMKSAGDYSSEEIEMVKTMVLDTAFAVPGDVSSRPVRTELSKYLLDADMSNLGRTDFFERLESARKETGEVKNEFTKRTQGLMLSHSWLSEAAKALRQEQKERNIQSLAESLS